MATQPLPDNVLRQAWEKIRETGSIINAAEQLGLKHTTLHSRLRSAIIRFGVPDPRSPNAPLTIPESDVQVKEPPTRIEIRNEKFWKAKAEELARELANTTHALHEVSGLMNRAPEPPKWSSPRQNSKNRAAGLLTISDIHAGEIIKADEIGGLNSYDLSTCRARIRRLFDAAVAILPRWASDCRLEGVYVALNGDLVSGDIHDELRRTNALTSMEQVWFVTDELAAGLTKLADEFGNVYVCVTPGNHGRSTLKTHAKGTVSLSYDTMVGEALKRHFQGDKRLTFNISAARDATYKIFNWNVLQTHNDAGGGGGQGFAGPMLPILRKSKAIEYMSAQTRMFHDIIVTGHFHVSGNLGKILANGSVVGYGEFAQSIRAAPEPAQQWAALIHEKWGIRERSEIKLQNAE